MASISILNEYFYCHHKSLSRLSKKKKKTKTTKIRHIFRGATENNARVSKYIGYVGNDDDFPFVLSVCLWHECVFLQVVCF